MDKKTMRELGYLPAENLNTKNMDDYIIFNKKNSTGSKNSADPTVTFSPKGLVTLNAALMLMLGLDDKSKVIFLKKKDTKDWYVTKSDDADAFSIRKYTSGKGAGFNCSLLAQTVLKDVAGVKVGGKPFDEKKAARFIVNPGEIVLDFSKNEGPLLIKQTLEKCHLILISSLHQ